MSNGPSGFDRNASTQSDRSRVRRKKPWYRARNIVGAVAGLFLLVAAREVWFALTAKPNPKTDYLAELIELSGSYQPSEGANGWDQLIQALAQAEATGAAYEEEQNVGLTALDDHWHRDFYRVLYDPYDPSRFEHERRIIEQLRQAGIFDQIEQAVAAPRAIRITSTQQGGLLNIALPALSHARRWARIREATMRIAAEEGDHDEFISAFRQTMGVARMLSYQYTLIDRLVAEAMRSSVLSELRHDLSAMDVDDLTRRQLLDILDRGDVFPPLELAFECERRFLYDFVQRTHTDNGRGSGRLLLSALRDYDATLGLSTGVPQGAGSLINVAGIVFPSRRQTTNQADAYYDQVIAYSRLSPVERLDTQINPNEWIKSLPRTQIVLRLMMPALSSSVSHENVAQVQVTGTRIIIGIEAYRTALGSYPESLDQLVPDFLDEIPVDPTHGGTFIYRRVNDDPDGRPYLLYSTGLDQEDNDGLAPTGTQVNSVDPLTKRTGFGFDYVINSIRPVYLEQ